MTIIGGDCRDILPTLDAESVALCCTSVPYLEQRRYGDHAGEIGHEPTLEAYVAALGHVFHLVGATMIPGGWLALNIGDKANNSGGAGGDFSKTTRIKNPNAGMGKFRDRAYLDGTFLDVPGAVVRELLLMGWRLRMPIVWDKGQQAPEDLRHVRRPRWQHEMIYLMTWGTERPRFFPSFLEETGSVWHFPSGGNGDPHLAPFPDELARRAILPTTLPGDLVLDPFSGSGTTVEVAEQLGRRGIGIELYR